MSDDSEKFGFLSGINITIIGDDVMNILTAPLLWVAVIGGIALYGYQLHIQHYKIKVDAGIIKPRELQQSDSLARSRTSSEKLPSSHSE